MIKLLAILLIGLAVPFGVANRVVNTGGGGGSPETITYASLDTSQYSGVSSDTVNATGVTAGNDMFLLISCTEQQTVSSVDNSFNLVATQVNGDTGSDSPRGYLYHKVASGSETTITVTLSANSNGALSLIEVGGTDTTTRTTISNEDSIADFTLTGVTVPTNGAAIQFVVRKDNPWASFTSYPTAITTPDPDTVISTNDNSNAGLWGLYISYIPDTGATGGLLYDTTGFGRWVGFHTLIQAGTL